MAGLPVSWSDPVPMGTIGPGNMERWSGEIDSRDSRTTVIRVWGRGHVPSPLSYLSVARPLPVHLTRLPSDVEGDTPCLRIRLGTGGHVSLRRADRTLSDHPVPSDVSRGASVRVPLADTASLPRSTARSRTPEVSHLGLGSPPTVGPRTSREPTF